jgi:hypothetical protein
LTLFCGFYGLLFCGKNKCLKIFAKIKAELNIVVVKL